MAVKSGVEAHTLYLCTEDAKPLWEKSRNCAHKNHCKLSIRHAAWMLQKFNSIIVFFFLSAVNSSTNHAKAENWFVYFMEILACLLLCVWCQNDYVITFWGGNVKVGFTSCADSYHFINNKPRSRKIKDAGFLENVQNAFHRFVKSSYTTRTTTHLLASTSQKGRGVF